MPSWKKIIVSGSDASLNSLYSPSITGSLQGTASYANYASGSDSTTLTQLLVLNQSGYTITKGMVVRITGSNSASDIPRIVSASYETDAVSANTLGIASSNITNGSQGYIITEGVLTGIDTSGWTSGTLLFLGATGSITTTYPAAPLHSVRLGQVIREQSNNGSIAIRIDNGNEVGELHDVIDNTTTSSYGDLFVKSGSVWINSKQLTGSYGITGSIEIASGFAYKQDGSNVIYIEKGTDSYYANTIAGASAGTNGITRQTVYGNATGNSSTGSNQSAFGFSAGRFNTGSDQTAIGYFAGYNNSGIYQTIVGSLSGYNNIGMNQTAIGYNSGRDNIGIYQTAVGFRAGFVNSGSHQTVVGNDAGYYNNANFQTAIGVFAGYYNSGSNQTTVGYLAGAYNSGSDNTNIGYQAGYYTTGITINSQSAQSVFLGSQTTAGGANRVNQIVIGYGANGIGNNSVVLGNTSITTTVLRGNVGIGTTTPSASLHISGSSIITGSLTTTGSVQFSVLSGSNSRIVEASSMGAITASREIISGYISDSTVITQLTTSTNWTINGAYTGSAITGTYQGQNYYDDNYFYTFVADNTPIRLIRG